MDQVRLCWKGPYSMMRHGEFRFDDHHAALPCYLEADSEVLSAKGMYLWAIVLPDGRFKVSYAGCSHRANSSLRSRLEAGITASLKNRKTQQIIDPEAFRQGHRHLLRKYLAHSDTRDLDERIDEAGGRLAKDLMREVVESSVCFLAKIKSDPTLIRSGVESTIVRALYNQASYGKPECSLPHCRRYLSNGCTKNGERPPPTPTHDCVVRNDTNDHQILGLDSEIDSRDVR